MNATTGLRRMSFSAGVSEIFAGVDKGVANAAFAAGVIADPAACLCELLNDSLPLRVSLSKAFKFALRAASISC